MEVGREKATTRQQRHSIPSHNSPDPNIMPVLVVRTFYILPKEGIEGDDREIETREEGRWEGKS